MRFIVMLFVSVLYISSARAGTIVMTVTTAAGACTTPCTKTYTDTDVNLAKIATTYQAACNSALSTVCTTPQVLSWWFDQIIAAAVANVSQFDKSALSNAAVAGYTPINPH